jgi:hypothetical protein
MIRRAETRFLFRTLFIAAFLFVVLYALKAENPITERVNANSHVDDNEVDGYNLDFGIGFSSVNALSDKNASKTYKNVKNTLFVNNEVSQPTFSPNITFSIPLGLSLSGYANIIGNSDSTQTKATTSFDLSLGYYISLFDDKLSIYPSITHYFYSKNSTSVTSLLKNQLSLDGSYEFKWLCLSVGGSYLNGESNDFGLNSQFYIPITFESFLSENGQLSICPGMNVVFGNQSFNSDLLIQGLFDGVKDIQKKRTNFNPTIAQVEKSSKLKKTLDALNKLVFGKTSLNGNEYFFDYMNRVDAATAPKFKLSSVGISVPFYYSIYNLSIGVSVSFLRALNTANPNAKLLDKNLVETENTDSFLFSGSIAYNFDWQ